MRPTIDLADDSDLETLVELAVAFRDHLDENEPTREAFVENFAALLSDADTEFLLARDEAGAAIGYAQIRYRRSAWAPGTAAELEDLFVVRGARGGGTGRALLDAMTARASSRGCRMLYVATNERNTAARSLYESSGFSAAKAHWDGGLEIWLQRRMGPAAAATIRLRPTRADDLAFVLRHERRAENTPFIGQWSEEEHRGAIADPEREHYIIEGGGIRLGYLIAYDLRRGGDGVYVKRIVVADKSRGLGRAAMDLYCRHAFDDLGAAFVWLSVYPENERAQRTYHAAGFGDFTPDDEMRARLRAATGHSGTSLLMRRLSGGA
jgi:ribosomal protein S18 acetylase RimI-like enzyme